MGHQTTVPPSLSMSRCLLAPSPHHILIWQQNVASSWTLCQDRMQEATLLHVDALLIQDPPLHLGSMSSYMNY